MEPIRLRDVVGKSLVFTGILFSLGILASAAVIELLGHPQGEYAWKFWLTCAGFLTALASGVFLVRSFLRTSDRVAWVNGFNWTAEDFGFAFAFFAGVIANLIGIGMELRG